jgi:O-antigen/teichoic acid export membrane protein
MAFLLRIIATAAGSLLSLLWGRLLVRAMGNVLWTLFDAFQAVGRLGLLGDLGTSGAVMLKAGAMLGKRDDEGLRKLLASARSLFLLVAVGIFVSFAVFSPGLPSWLNFHQVPNAGSLPLLFIFGGVSAAATIIGGYFAALNYANGTVTWPILPSLIIGQIVAPFIHWKLALLGMPLWVQYSPYTFTAAIAAIWAWLMVRWSHPWLGNLRPLKCNFNLWKTLAGMSGWLYLSTLGNVIYTTTDRLVINAHFDPGILLPRYRFNGKICDLALTLIISASFVSLPKLTQWLASPAEADQRRLRVEASRLNTFQIVLVCGIALGYLALNDLFIRLWQGADYNAPLAWQVAFAANLAVTAGGEVGIQMCFRNDRDLKTAGLMFVGTGLLNLGLSILAVKFESVTGVAVATVVAQSILSLTLNWLVCRRLGYSPFGWLGRSWLLPLGLVLAGAALKMWLPHPSLSNIGALFGLYALLFFFTCILAGVNKEMIYAEIKVLRSALKI